MPPREAQVQSTTAQVLDTAETPFAAIFEASHAPLGLTTAWGHVTPQGDAGHDTKRRHEGRATVHEELRHDIARRLKLPYEKVFSDQSLSVVLAASPVATNSIDLLDAFAGAIVDQGLDEELDLPTFTLNRSANDVVATLSGAAHEVFLIARAQLKDFGEQHRADC